MAKPSAAKKIPLARARAAMIAAQELDGTAGGSIASVLERTGFVRTLGGVEAYLAVRARLPKLRRADLDAAAEKGDVQVVPAVRGCMYLVGRAHVPLCLRLADRLSSGRAEKEQAKAGIRKGEVESVSRLVLDTLKAQGPMTTDTLRRALPAGSVRSLGEAGKKVGLSSPLPPALRRLEFEGAIERRTETGRLDTERYVWRRAGKDPFKGAKLPDDT